MKHRKFKTSSVFLMYLIFAIISVLIARFIGKDNTVATLIIGIVAAFVEFAISRGLIVNRMGSLGDYFAQMKEINLNFFLLNIFIGLVGFLISLIAAGSMAAVFGAVGSVYSEPIRPPKGAYGLIALSVIVNLIFSMITAYGNLIVADPRNKGQSFGQVFKNTFSTGFTLLGKTILIALKYMVGPIAVLIVLVMAMTRSLATNPGPGSIGLGIALVVVFAVVVIYFAIKFKGAISDNYLNLVGDYKEDSDQDSTYEEEPLKLTREVEVDQDNAYEENKTQDEEDFSSDSNIEE